MIQKFRKKPVVIEAIQYTGENDLTIEAWSCRKAKAMLTRAGMIIKTLEGEMQVDINDWVIKGIAGEFYPCKPDIFDKTYELVVEE